MGNNQRMLTADSGRVVHQNRRWMSSENPSFSSSDLTILVESDSEERTSTRLVKPRGITVADRYWCNAIAKWRKRVSARNNIFWRLRELGPLAAISCGGLLMWDRSFPPTMFESCSRWKETLKNSSLYLAVKDQSKGALIRAPRVRFERLEDALRSFGQMLCLATEDLYDVELYVAWAEFKLWAVENGMTESNQDRILQSIKALSKLCQSIFLRGEIDYEALDLVPRMEDNLLPFAGGLSFISDFFFGRRKRTSGLTLEEGRALAQIGAASRALPYPSDKQVCESVDDTMCIITQENPEVSKSALRSHCFFLKKYISRILPKDESKRTHMSLTNSAAEECPRSEGGKAGYLVKLAKRFASQAATTENLSWLSGRVDCFGTLLGHPASCMLAAKIIVLPKDDEGYFDITLGDVVYNSPNELFQKLKEIKAGNSPVPNKLGELMLNISCLDMLKFGSYEHEPSTKYDILSFDGKYKDQLSLFHMSRDSLPVRASVSIEAGMKTRLVTSAPAAVTQLGQLLGNKAREYLSRDPFVRVGFQESDKLWEVLKAYDKRVARRKASSEQE